MSELNEETKSMSIRELLVKISASTDFKICDMEARKFLSMFFSKIYNELKETDEILLEDVGGEFYSIKRTPTLEEQKQEYDKSQVIISQSEQENNFKVFFTRKDKICQAEETKKINDLL